MQLRLLKVAILFTVSAFSAIAAPFYSEVGLQVAVEPHSQEHAEVNHESPTPLMSESEIRSCIDNTYDLEAIMRWRVSTAKVLDGYLTNSLEAHKINKERLRGLIERFSADCEYLGENCRSLEAQKRYLQEEIEAEREIKREVVEYINMAISFKEAEKHLRASFDVDCQYKPYDKALVKKLCRESFASDDPICRDR